MCGIAGKIYFNSGEVKPSELSLMAQKIAHRGPDDEGIWISSDRKVGLVNRRLAIIDLSPKGHQPMSYRNRYWIIYNGEVFNFQKEKARLEREGYKFKSKSDTEVILALYDKYGVGCLRYLRGFYAFAIYDDLKKTVFLARDRLGKKPLKYFYNRNVFIFASELKAIITQKEVSKTPDYVAIHHYLTFGYTPAPLTGFEKIEKLEPAHYLFIDLAKKIVTKKRYWKLDFSKKLDLSENEWREKILEELEETTRMRMIADVPIGAFLSGGVDSSAVVAMMAKLSKNPVKTFTIRFKDRQFDESKYARKVANIYKTDHIELIAEPEDVEKLPELVYQFEEPFADNSTVVTYMVSKLARGYVKVILNGDGGDESFAGYDRYFRWQRDVFFDQYLKPLRPILLPLAKLTLPKITRFLEKSKKDLAQRYLSYFPYFTEDEKRRIYLDNFREIVNDRVSWTFYKEMFLESKAADLEDQALYADISMYFPDDLLTKVDIAGMAVGLEGRSPMADHKFIEMAAQIPFSLKVKNKTLKYIFKKALQGLVPKENLYRSKMGFTIPLSRWFTGKLSNYAKNILLSKEFRSRGLFDQSAVRQMLRLHSEKTDFAPKIWSLLVLELWMREYFD